MVNLKEKPFFLSDADIAWVNETIAGMTDEEKVGQLFINMNLSREPEYMADSLSRYHYGGVRYPNAAPEEIYAQNKFLQEQSKIPLLIASNCEQGGSGGVTGGTYVASSAQSGASCTAKTAYDCGLVSGAEGSAIGCNWNFAPVVDIYKDWRNTIVNTRAFSDDADEVIALSREFIKGLHQSGVAECAKHFPGDGTEERDHHLLLGVNTLSCEEWDATFGKVYKTLIDDGLMSIMVGHICQPAYSRKLCPGIADADILPASLSPELLSGLLRGQLGYNGLLLTDASHMVGMWEHFPRSEQVPRAIAAGCDMFLFFNDPDEDFGYMLNGYQNGCITEERMHDALCRILGMKAALKLHLHQKEHTLVKDKANLSVIGCAEHLKIAEKAADDSITLVKDTKHLLPITPEKYKKIKLFYISGDLGGLAGATDDARDIIIDELTKAGFTVTLNDGNEKAKGSMKALHESCDAALVFADVAGYARENVKRISWATQQSSDVPWYACEVPTVFVSLNFTTHLYDVPMCRTYINAYGDSRAVIHAAVEKIMGKSEFKGHYNDTVWCGKWDTHL
ncbi:MAG: glycoside hydrolase family 3 N-terminal domain-containing protein [Ruthenibacterium sp.]